MPKAEGGSRLEGASQKSLRNALNSSDPRFPPLRGKLPKAEGGFPLRLRHQLFRGFLVSTFVIPALRRGYLAALGTKDKSPLSDGNVRRSSDSSVGATLREIPATERGNDESSSSETISRGVFLLWGRTPSVAS